MGCTRRMIIIIISENSKLRGQVVVLGFRSLWWNCWLFEMLMKKEDINIEDEKKERESLWRGQTTNNVEFWPSKLTQSEE